MAEIFHITHDAGNFGEYDTAPTGSILQVQAAAGLNGTDYGIEKSNPGGGAADGDLSIDLSTASSVFRIGFYADLNDVSFSTPEDDLIMYLQGDFNGYEFRIILADSGSGFFIRVDTAEDDFSENFLDTTAGGLPSGEFTVEVVWTRASSAVANDGICQILINGTQANIVSNLDMFDSWDDIAATFTNFIISVDLHAGMTGSFYYDEIILRDDSTPIYPPPASGNTFRFLGFDADNENLYATGLKNAGTLQLFNYDLPTLTEAGTTSFGSGTDAELDARTRGIFPVIKPMADQILYLRGRDGNNVQVQYNDQNGTLGWVDIGPGTATWATDKYAVGLLTAPTYTDDVIAVFSDDDVYRTRFGTASWVKMGDAGGGLRAAARHPNRFNEIIAGGTAAGTVEWSNNFGASFGDVSGTALGTINAFEVSL
jgi:hypothetical protein